MGGKPRHHHYHQLKRFYLKDSSSLNRFCFSFDLSFYVCLFVSFPSFSLFWPFLSLPFIHSTFLSILLLTFVFLLPSIILSCAFSFSIHVYFSSSEFTFTSFPYSLHLLFSTDVVLPTFFLLVLYPCLYLFIKPTFLSSFCCLTKAF